MGHVSTFTAWLQASRPLAQANIAPPLLLGQALAFAVTGRFSAGLCAWTLLFGVLDHGFIVFSNDFADAEADRLHDRPTLFSGGSRVIVQGKLSRRAVGGAALACAAALAAWTLVTATVGERPAVVLHGALALALMAAYSFPPLRLSYRGGGELLQALGVGAVLPSLGFVVQSGSLGAFPWVALVCTVVLGYAGNVTTALPDRDADRRADKRTVPVRFGLARAKALVLVLLAFASIAAPLLGPSLSLGPSVAVAAAPLGCVLVAALSRTHTLRFVLWSSAAQGTLLVGWSIALFVQ
jgi:1,4-dihydroxy-2-naphthoate octaprenyltransferase